MSRLSRNKILVRHLIDIGAATGNPTTSIYIDLNQAKVDEANRRVLDFVFGQK